MSYALRNTLILLVVLIAILGSGMGYFHYIQKPLIASLETSVSEKEKQLSEMRSIADQLPGLQQQFEESNHFIENFQKSLLNTSNPDQVYRFLSILSATDPVNFNFTFNDSTLTDRYGIVRSTITGDGTYRSVMNFISRIEHSEPVQKINNVVLNPTGQTPGYNYVNFTFNLSTYFDRLKLLEAGNTPGVSDRVNLSAHNPFFPLIRNVEPNVDNLTNVENSRLVGIGTGVVYLVNQNGQMVTLRENDSVYLGRLITIDVNSGKAIFRLNKGGIIETVTKEVQR